MLGDENIEDVESFVYLGSKVTKDGRTAQDVVQRIQKANGAFVQLHPVWRNNKISIRTKLRIFRSNVDSATIWFWDMESGKTYNVKATSVR